MNYTIDLLDTPALLALPEPEWLIDGIIHQQEMGVLYGPPNVGKSFVALDWALSVASGVPWVGTYATHRTPVLYMAGEGGASLQKRVDAWLLSHPGADPLVFFQCRPRPILDPTAIEDLRGAMQGYMVYEDQAPGFEPGLIVVDTLSQFMGGGDENGPEMAEFVATLRYLSQDQESAVLIVHHTNKGGVQERGHTALRGNVDVMFSVSGKKADNQLSSIEILNDKQRDDACCKPIAVSVSSCNRSLTLSLRKTELLPPTAIALTSESLKKLLLVTGSIEDSSQEIWELADWRLESGMPERTFYHNLHILLKLKLIRKAGRGKYQLTPAGRETLFHYR